MWGKVSLNFSLMSFFICEALAYWMIETYTEKQLSVVEAVPSELKNGVHLLLRYLLSFLPERVASLIREAIHFLKIPQG